MFFSKLAVSAIVVAAQVHAAVDLLTDISQISRSWGEVSAYGDNDEDYFGVGYVGLPDGCQIVSTLSALITEYQLTNLGICQHSATPCTTISYELSIRRWKRCAIRREAFELHFGEYIRFVYRPSKFPQWISIYSAEYWSAYWDWSFDGVCFWSDILE